MNYDEVQTRLEVSVQCILADILTDFDNPEDADFDYENCASLDELALNLSDMIQAHFLDSDDMLEFRGAEKNWLGL